MPYSPDPDAKAVMDAMLERIRKALILEYMRRLGALQRP